jgi:hypothetical protein
MELTSLLEPRLNQRILEARLNGLWRVLKYRSVFGTPSISDESSHGPHDAGGIFIPGPFMFMEAGGNKISSSLPADVTMTKEEFDLAIATGLETDCASLIYSGEVKTRVSIPSFYEQLVPKLLGASYADKMSEAQHDPQNIDTSFATLLLMPDYVNPLNAVGRKVKATSALSICFSRYTTDNLVHFSKASEVRNVFVSTSDLEKAYMDSLKPVYASDGTLLYKPSIVVLHSTRHAEEVLTGLTRFLNYDLEHGQFQTLTFENFDSNIQSEFLAKEGKVLSKDYLVASYNGVRAVCVLRNYIWDNGGVHLRPHASEVHVLHPSEFPFSVSEVSQKAKDEYAIRHPILEGARQIGKGFYHLFG